MLKLVFLVFLIFNDNFFWGEEVLGVGDNNNGLLFLEF